MAEPSTISNARFTYVHDDGKFLPSNAVDTHHIVARRSVVKPIAIYLFVILLVAHAAFLHLEKQHPQAQPQLQALLALNNLAREVQVTSPERLWEWNPMPSEENKDYTNPFKSYLSYTRLYYHPSVYAANKHPPKTFKKLGRYIRNREEEGKPVTIVIWSVFFGALLIKLLIWSSIVKESVVIMPAFGVQLETHYGSGRINRCFIPVSKILKPVLNECVTPVTCCWCLSLLVHEKDELTLVFKEFRPPLKMLVPIWKALCAATDHQERSDPF